MFITNKPLILASSSKIRQELLASVGLSFVTRAAAIDESTLKRRHQGLSPETLSLLLAKEKAITLSSQEPGQLIIGCDQLCCCEDKVLSKPGNENRCFEQLRFLSGKTHQLHSAVCLASEGQIIWSHISTATLTMRELTDNQIHRYISLDKPFYSCGSYYFESFGRHLFQQIEGDQDSILGLPLVPLLNALYKMEVIQM